MRALSSGNRNCIACITQSVRSTSGPAVPRRAVHPIFEFSNHLGPQLSIWIQTSQTDSESDYWLVLLVACPLHQLIGLNPIVSMLPSYFGLLDAFNQLTGPNHLDSCGRSRSTVQSRRQIVGYGLTCIQTNQRPEAPEQRA